MVDKAGEDLAAHQADENRVTGEDQAVGKVDEDPAAHRAAGKAH